MSRQTLKTLPCSEEALSVPGMGAGQRLRAGETNLGLHVELVVAAFDEAHTRSPIVSIYSTLVSM